MFHHHHHLIMVCGILATILIVIVAVVVTIYTAGAGAAVFGAVGAGGAGATAGAAGLAVVGGTAAATGALTVAGTLAIAAVAGAVGAAAGQLVGMALGVQDKFSWKDVALGGLAGGIGAGVGAAAQGVSAAGGWINKASGSAKWWRQAAVTSTSAVVSQAANYGANQLVGNKSKFNWASLAVTAITAPVASSLGNDAANGVASIGGDKFATSFAGGVASRFANKLVSGTISGVAQQVFANNGKYDFAQVAADAFGNAIADELISYYSISKEIRQLDATRAQKNELNALRERAMQNGFTAEEAASLVNRTHGDWNDPLLGEAYPELFL